MLSFDPFSGLSSLGKTSSSSSAAGLADDFDTFLSLLTTQLRNQNPLDPLDTNQFTQQLVQFAGVEQDIKQNKNLENLSRLSAASAITGAVSYIGKEVTTSGTSSRLRNGEAAWSVNAPSGSAEATFIVRNSAGLEVFSKTGPLSEGQYSFRWDGKRLDGTTAPDGDYTLQIIAKDSDGIAVSATTTFAGIVDAVDMKGTEPLLMVNGRELKLSEITSIKDNINP